MLAAFLQSPGAGESEHLGPLRAISQILIAHGSRYEEPHGFSKLSVLRTHLSGEDLKSWGA